MADQVDLNEVNELIHGLKLYDEAATYIDMNSFALFEFQGFDAATIAKQMLVKAKTSSAVLKDVTTFCTLAATRGFDITKIMRRMSAAGIQVISALYQKYGMLTSNQNATTLKATDITLQRIVATFPHIFIRVAVEKFKYIGLSPMNFWTFSPLYCCPVGAILVPDDKFVEWQQWAEEYNFIINRSKAEGPDFYWARTQRVIAAQRAVRSQFKPDLIASIEKTAAAFKGAHLFDSQSINVASTGVEIKKTDALTKAAANAGFEVKDGKIVKKTATS